MKINIRDLKTVCNLLLADLEEFGIVSVELEDDYYWFIQREQRYSPYNSPDPATFTIGQLTDDWTELQKILSGEFEPTPLALSWLASLLLYIGEKGYK